MFLQERGLDAGGLTREWCLLTCESVFDVALGLFANEREGCDASGVCVYVCICMCLWLCVLLFWIVCLFSV